VRVIVGVGIALFLGFPLSAQDTTAGAPDSTTSKAHKPYRDPHKALVLGSIIPGAGHIYAGEYFKGFVNYEATVGAIGLGTMVFIADKCMFAFLNTTPCKSGPAWPHQALGVALVGIGIWGWISSARDARHAAERANVRHDARRAVITPFIAPFSGPASAPQIGVSLQW
jgi:hypothetical protein